METVGFYVSLPFKRVNSFIFFLKQFPPVCITIRWTLLTNSVLQTGGL